MKIGNLGYFTWWRAGSAKDVRSLKTKIDLQMENCLEFKKEPRVQTE